MKKNNKLFNLLVILFIIFIILFRTKNIEKFSQNETEKSIDCEIDIEYCKDEKNSEECQKIFEKYQLNYIPNNIKKWCIENA